MLPKRKRLTRKRFEAVFREGRSYNASHVALRTKATPGESLISVAVAGKAAKGAADRNRLRREGYAAIEGLNSPLPHDLSAILLIRKKPPKGILKKEIQSLLHSLLKQ
ncbi:ribonuclease P protein component [Candidatus Parcubacteria bacterium]|nr:ribonuclease P protein component [Candidatus Parcubacteria bacterium]